MRAMMHFFGSVGENRYLRISGCGSFSSSKPDGLSSHGLRSNPQPQSLNCVPVRTAARLDSERTANPIDCVDLIHRACPYVSHKLEVLMCPYAKLMQDFWVHASSVPSRQVPGVSV